MTHTDPFDSRPSDIVIKRQSDLDTTLIAGISQEILTTLLSMGMDPLTIHSILTTAFVNYMKRMLRESPPSEFENNRKVAISLLEKLLTDIKGISQNARSSEDVSEISGRDGGSDRRDNEPNGHS